MLLKLAVDLYKAGWVTECGLLNLLIKYFMGNSSHVGEIFRKLWSWFFSKDQKRKALALFRRDHTVFLSLKVVMIHAYQNRSGQYERENLIHRNGSGKKRIT